MVGRCKKFSLQQCFCLLTLVLNSIISAWIRRFLYWAWRKENPSPLKCHRNRVAELSQILFEYLGGLLTKTILFNPNSFNLVHYQHALPLCLCSRLGLLCSSRRVTELGLNHLIFFHTKPVGLVGFGKYGKFHIFFNPSYILRAFFICNGRQRSYQAVI